jgi:hypothetical protein
MLNPVTPEDYDANGDGSDDDAAVAQAVAEHNATGRTLIFRNSYGITSGKQLTRSDADVHFTPGARFIAIGSSAMYPMLPL